MNTVSLTSTAGESGSQRPFWSQWPAPNCTLPGTGNTCRHAETLLNTRLNRQGRRTSSSSNRPSPWKQHISHRTWAENQFKSILQKQTASLTVSYGLLVECLWFFHAIFAKCSGFVPEKDKHARKIQTFRGEITLIYQIVTAPPKKNCIKITFFCY